MAILPQKTLSNHLTTSPDIALPAIDAGYMERGVTKIDKT